MALLRQLPRELGIGVHDCSYLYFVLRTEYKDFGMRPLADAIWKIVQARNQSLIQSETHLSLLNISEVFAKKDLGLSSRKAGLTEFARLGTKTPVPRSPTGASTRKAAAASTFGEAVKVTPKAGK